MKKKIGVIVALSIMITGINYPTYSVYAQEENQDIFSEHLYHSDIPGTYSPIHLQVLQKDDESLQKYLS